jgi:predicted cupin superfamily sugar epimerase
MPSKRVERIISELGLVPHPERGYFVETHRATTTVVAATHDGERAASTAIYFMVTAEGPSTYLHRLASDEVFHLYDGGPLDILRLMPDGTGNVARLGLDLENGERPQVVIAKGTWFGTELVGRAEYCLVGCTVAPGFEFRDFELAQGPELRERYPAFSDRIGRMLRPSS